jgi:hypothetical protein
MPGMVQNLILHSWDKYRDWGCLRTNCRDKHLDTRETDIGMDKNGQVILASTVRAITWRRLKCVDMQNAWRRNKFLFTLKEEHSRSWTMVSIDQCNSHFLSSVRNSDDMTVSNTEGSQQMWFNLKSSVYTLILVLHNSLCTVNHIVLWLPIQSHPIYIIITENS